MMQSDEKALAETLADLLIDSGGETEATWGVSDIWRPRSFRAASVAATLPSGDTYEVTLTVRRMAR